jgi:hypothetical protein
MLKTHENRRRKNNVDGCVPIARHARGRHIPQSGIKFHLQNKLPQAICNDKHEVAPAGGTIDPPVFCCAIAQTARFWVIWHRTG